MNKERAARAYDTIAEGFAELAIALRENEQPAARGPVSPQVAPAPVDYADEPPIGDQFDYDPPPPLLRDQHVENVLGQCPDHQRNWRVVPAGVSKRTGKEYSAFYSCPERDCKKRPVKAWQDAHPIAA